MKSSAAGKRISKAEIAHISAFGVWVLVRGREYFMPYDKFPWFRDATVRAILNLKMPNPGHLHWPDLDVDLDLDCLEHPDCYPLVYR